MKTYVITNCSSTRTQTPVALCKDLPKNIGMREAFESWLDILKQHEESTTPRELYRGIAFKTIAQIADMLDNNVRIITGGQGCITLDTPIVPYDFSASKHEQYNVLQSVTKEPFVPTWWWEMINTAKRNDPSPLATLIDAEDTDFVIIAVHSFFLKYIKQDLLNATNRQKVIIVSTTKSYNDIPIPYRNNVIFFDRRLADITSGNRNDTTHRACLYLLKLMQTMTEVTVENCIEEVEKSFTNNLQSRNKRTAQEVLDEMSSLLAFDSVEQAYAEARKNYGAFGGISNFRAEWMKRKHGVKQVKITAEIDKLAMQAFESVQGLQKIESVMSDDSENKLLDALAVFVSIMRNKNPSGIVKCGDICEWLKTYYTLTQEILPERAEQPIKFAHFMASNAAYLGLVKVKIPGVSALQYKLNNDN